MLGVNSDVPAPLLRRADGLVLHIAGADAVVERPGAPALHFADEGARLHRLWDLLDVPRPARTLIAELGDPAAGDLLRRLIDAGALSPWPLATRLAQLHRATVAPATVSAVMPGWEDSRLLRDYGGERSTDLPEPELTADLAAALTRRRTVRRLSGAWLSLAQLSTLLAFGAGCPAGPAVPLVAGGPPGRRTYPSAGALYPIEMLVVPIFVEGMSVAHYRYQVLSHRLSAATTATKLTSGIQRMFVDNQVSGVSVVFLLWVDFTRPSLGKYGDKVYRLALLEAGHLAQSVLLVAAALGLAGVPLCGFDDEVLALEAGLAYPEQAIVYVVGVGSPLAPIPAPGEQP